MVYDLHNTHRIHNYAVQLSNVIQGKSLFFNFFIINDLYQ